MPYTHTTYEDLRLQFAKRLGDNHEIFWTADEKKVYLTEALRAFGICAGFWRERTTLNTSQSTVFYDLRNLPLLTPTVTDRYIIKQLQYHLLESIASQASWNGTEQFTYDAITSAIQNRLNQFLSDTGIVVTRSLINVQSPPVGRQPLSQSVIDVRRAAWLGVYQYNYYATLWREDERSLTAADFLWNLDPGTPEAYSILGPPPLTLQLAPPPVTNGQLELLTVDSTFITPSSIESTLGIPDDLSPAIKWGALADLLGQDGIARDPARAQFCEQRYQQYVQLAREIPLIVHAEINGVSLIPVTLFEVDSAEPDWENSLSIPQDLIIASPNLIAFNPVPDDIYSATLDVVRPAPIPADDTFPLQIGREQLDMILDYAEHLALFKSGGKEFEATQRQADNFLQQAVTYNERISASARTVFASTEQSHYQKYYQRRRVSGGAGPGALNKQNA